MVLTMLKTANLQGWGTNIQQLIDKTALSENLCVQSKEVWEVQIHHWCCATSQGGWQFR